MEHNEINEKELTQMEINLATHSFSEADIARLIKEVRWLRGVCIHTASKVTKEVVERAKVIQTLKTIRSENDRLRVIASDAQVARDTAMKLKEVPNVRSVDRPGEVAARNLDEVRAEDFKAPGDGPC